MARHKPTRCFGVLAALAVAASALAGPPTNVVVVLVDDWGWTDAGSLGSDLYQTPHIDRFKDESVYFDNAYSACTVCSPTRAALMTGMYPARLRLTNYIPGARQPPGPLREPAWTSRLEHRHTTIAEALREEGYRTAHVGKWHLTPFALDEMSDYLPQRHGFEVNIGGNRRGQPGSYFHPYNSRRVSIGELPPGGQEGDYLTDRLTDEAIRLVRRWRDEPFFLYLAYYAVHTPIQPKPELAAEYAERVRPDGKHTNPGYAAMVDTLDANFGRLRAALAEAGVAERTLVVLTSDNGGLRRGITNNAPLRSGKSHEFEGGVRVPLMIHAPTLNAQPATCHEPVITMDLYPTVLELAGAAGDASHNASVDGLSLTPLLREPTAQLPRDTIYWHYPHYQGTTPYGAVRSRQWRLIEYYEDNRVALFELDNDLGETTDLASAMPEKAAALRDQLHAWRDAVNAQMPSRVHETPTPR